MIEALIIQYLSRYLEVPVFGEVPENPPLRFVIIEKTGGSRANRINSSTLAIQSYAETMYDAAMLNEKVKELMDDAITLEDIASVKYQSDYNYTDTAAKQYRYQAVYAITHYL